MTTPTHTKFARNVLGADPILAPEHFVIIAGGDQEAGRKTVGRYLELDNYRRNLVREGWDDADIDNGGSDMLIEARSPQLE